MYGITAHWSRAVVGNSVQCVGRNTAEVPGCVAFLDTLTCSVDGVPTPFSTLRFGTLPHLAPYDLEPYYLAPNHLAP